MIAKVKKAFERLPKNVIPTLYEVQIQPDLVALTFSGWERVTVLVKSATNKIVLNTFDITVGKASLSVKNTGKEYIPEINHVTEEEKVEFIFPEPVQPGEYFLILEFIGCLNDQLRGFYRNKYVTPSGETQFAAGTHFEATGARRAYPCWDEPAIKARFAFTLVVPKDRTALSNMPIEKEELWSQDSELKVVKFALTPVMSTYLTAFVVGEYDFISGETSNGIPVRVFTPLGKKEHGRFALEVATKALSYYEWYFDVPYGLPKLDLITLSEFPIGAMENWGLVTYRETALLVDPINSSASTRQYVAIVVTHELSHNWFGNLVTMEWWTDLWLKEGFATWIEYQCTNILYPEFNIWNTFIKNDQSRALELDALSTSHPVEVQVSHPGEIDEIFDEISYCKGACLIRMLQSYIGDEAFRKGMKLYLNRHAHSNTSTKDMWAAMSEASGQDIGQIMDTWTKQMGFPLVKVKEELNSETTSRKVTLTQEKFSSEASQPGLPPSDQSWVVPFTITTARSPTKPVVTGLLDCKTITVDVPSCQPEDWIHVNTGQYMFYHVQYQPDTLLQLLPAIQQNVLSPEDRIGLLTDLFALCRSNYSSVVEVLKVTQSFRDETNFAVCGKLASALSGLSPLVQQISGGKDQCYKKFFYQTFQKIGDRLGWDATETESHSNRLMREQVLLRLGHSGDEKTVAEAFRRFDEHCSGKARLAADIRTPVYATVLIHGGKQVFDTMLQMYEREDNQEEKNRISRLLGCVSDKKLILEVLKFALSNKVRNQDSVSVLAGVTGSLLGRQLVWTFVQDNWEELHRRYGTSTMLSRLIRVITDGVASQERVDEIQTFFETRDAKAAERAIQQGLEHIQANIAFIKQQGTVLLEYLQSQAT